jgi:hypothetical protein
MKRVIVAGVLVLAVAGASIGSMFGIQKTKPIVAQDAAITQPSQSSTLVSNPSPTQAAPAVQNNVDAVPPPSSTAITAETPAAPQPQTNSGTGPGSFSFTPTSADWTVSYTYSGCGDQGIVFLTKMGNRTIGTSAPGDSGSSSFAGAGTSPVTIRVAVPDNAEWSLSVQ